MGGVEEEEKSGHKEEEDVVGSMNEQHGEKLNRQMSEASFCETEEEEDDEGKDVPTQLELGPQCSLKEQLEKDKVSLHFRFHPLRLTFSDLNGVPCNRMTRA